MRVFQTKINKSYSKKAYEVEPLKSEIKESTSLSFVLSVMAILISLSSVYLQFFYEKFELNVSLIDTKVKSDSLQLALIYNNKGNQDATIISSEIFFCSGNNRDEKEKRLYFIQKQNSPEILAPNKQLYKSQAVQTFFKDIKLNEYDIDPKDTIKIGLGVQFLNENMLQAEVLTNCGWITLDSLYSIDLYWVNYMKIPLIASSYFSSGYNSKIKQEKLKTILKNSWIDSLNKGFKHL